MASTGRVIVVAQSKGGVGKSTTATNASLYLRGDGDLVVLVDLGRQLESYDFMTERRDQLPDLPQVVTWTPWKDFPARDQERERVAETRAKIRAFAEKGAFVVIDCPPVDSEDSPLVEVALLEADLVVCPFLAGGNDYKAYGRCLTMVHSLKLKGHTPEAIAFMNKYSAQDNDDHAMRGFLMGSGVFTYIGEVPRGVEVKRSTALKKSVWEHKAKSNGGKAMLAVCTKIAAAARKLDLVEVSK